MIGMMRAVVASSAEAPLRVEELPIPQPGLGEVLVKIYASGVNPLDVKIHAGTAGHAKQPLPAVLGLDLAGVVVAVGDSVTRFAAGDEVFGMTGGVGGLQGTLAEYAAVDAHMLALKPASLTMREAAALPLVSITAWEGLVDRMHIATGQSLLVQGGAGGVGHVAVQIGRAIGASVFATGSARNKAKIEQLGATFIDRAEPVADYVARLTKGKGFDLVYDTAGGTALDASFEAVRPFGHVVSSLGWGTHRLAPLSFKNASYSGVFVLPPLLSGDDRNRQGKILVEIAKLVSAGKLVPSVDDRRFTMETTGEAYLLLKDGHSGSKLVVDTV